MSAAAQESMSTVLETNGAPVNLQDQRSDTSQKDLRSGPDPEAVSKSDQSDDTLFPADEIREEEGKGIDSDIWIDTLPFPDCLPPSLDCDTPQRCTEDIHPKDELHTSPENRDSAGQTSLGARKTTPDAGNTITVPPDLSSWGFLDLAGILPARKKRRSSTSEDKVYKSNGYHQANEDGRRTPPRRPTTEARPDSPCASHPSDKYEKDEQLVFDAGKTGLFYTLTERNDRTRPKTAILNLVALQRMNVHALQARLANDAAESFQTGRFDQDPEDLQQTLNLYCDAVRNLDFMREKAKLGYDRDPFLVKSSRALERGILESSGLIPHHVLPKGKLPLPEDHEHPLLSSGSGGRHHANEMTLRKQRLERFAMASFGGLLIIVPMLIMANVPGKVASLVTSCVAIAIFAALVTLGTKLGPHEVLASVAAYAAVLVVFVGLSLEKR